MRWLALVAGVALVVLAFGAAFRVADTREGLVAEIVTLLGGMAGVVLLIYGLAARTRRTLAPASSPRPPAARTAQARSRRDLVLGATGIALAAVLLSGLAVSGGGWWALLGGVLLLPMIGGSVYLCVRFLRAS